MRVVGYKKILQWQLDTMPGRLTKERMQLHLDTRPLNFHNKVVQLRLDIKPAKQIKEHLLYR